MLDVRIGFLGNFRADYSSETHHAKSLGQLGHHVTRWQETQTSADEVADADIDLLVWVHTHEWRTPGIISVALHELRRRGIPSITYHLDAYMQLPQRWRRYRTDPYMLALDHFFTVDACMADWLNEHTNVTGHYLPAGVYGMECTMATPRDRFDVCFVGSKNYHPEYPMRPKLIDWLHATYGDRFRHYGNGGRPNVRGAELNQVYADARVVVGDSLILDPNYAGKYWSDRIPETLGRGGFLLHPSVYGLDEQYKDGEHLVTYTHGDFDELKWLIDFYVDEVGDRDKIRWAGHQHARENHTYVNRWATILETVFG